MALPLTPAVEEGLDGVGGQRWRRCTRWSRGGQPPLTYTLQEETRYEVEGLNRDGVAVWPFWVRGCDG